MTILKKRTAINLLLLVGLVPLSSTACAKDKDRERVVPVPLVELLTNPRAFEGKYVQVGGYLRSDLRLYLTKEHADAFDSMSSVMVGDTAEGAISASSCIDAFVMVTGRLAQFDPGAFGLDSLKIIRNPTKRNELYCWRAVP